MSDIPVEARALHCPACGALVGKDDDQCNYCGASLVGIVGKLEVATPQMAQAVAEGLDYYAVLEVGPYATPNEIELAYHRQLERWTLVPPTMAEEAARKIELVEQAYAVLGDPSKRATYDTAIRYGVRYTPPGSTQDSALDGPEVLAHGKGLMTVKMYDQAAIVLEKAVRLMPESAEAHYCYGVSCLEAQSQDIFGIAPSLCQRIIQEMTTAQALDPKLTDAAAYKALAQALYLRQSGQEAEARQRVKDAIYCKPDWVLAYHVLAGFAFQAGEMDLAEKACLQALKLDPKNESVEFILANVRQRAQSEKRSSKQKPEKHR
jgi:curved DNA-binding protein CbpA